MVICDYCNHPAKLAAGSSIYPHRPDLYKLKFWLCDSCDAWVGCHKNSDAKPFGRLANKELRRAKSAAHAAFDPLWKGGSMSRHDAYHWLSSKMGLSFSECHIGMFDTDQCKAVIRICGESK